MDFQKYVSAYKLRRLYRRHVYVGIGAILLLILGIVFHFTFGAPQGRGTYSTFIVPQGTSITRIGELLHEQGFVRHAWTYKVAIVLENAQQIPAGGYSISKSMNAFQLVSQLQRPSSVWVTIPEGSRKEEIGAILAEKLDWSASELQEWNATDTLLNWATNPPENDLHYYEGVYFPDTYLVPVDETPAQAAARLQAQFAEVYSKLGVSASLQSRQWHTIVTVASLIQREAAGPEDMATISGIIWNRLRQNMPLNIDATLQYARGNTGAGYWAPISVSDKKIKSPHNTYANAGLPPTPIANPGFEALKAAVNPQKTECLYYLHDREGIIHCSRTYEGQLSNIQKYY